MGIEEAFATMSVATDASLTDAHCPVVSPAAARGDGQADVYFKNLQVRAAGGGGRVLMSCMAVVGWP